MSESFEYKGYLGSAEVDVESKALVGKLLFIRDTITYSASSVAELETAFQEAVDDYLSTCTESGDKPDVPCKGSFNVRVGAERHRLAAITARRMSMGLNEFVCAALDQAIHRRPTEMIVHIHDRFSARAATGGDFSAGMTTSEVWIKDVTTKQQH